MDSNTASSTDVASRNFQIGDCVTITVHPLFTGRTGEITALPSADAGIVALDSGGRERIPLSCLKLSNRLMSNDVPIGTSFNVEVLSSAPMTVEEARATIKQINGLCNQIRALLVELETREGYLALGFNSMAQLMNSNLFVKARSTLHKELLAGRIETQYLHVPVGTFSESHLRPLAKLKPEYYIEVLSQATQSAGARPMTARDVSAAVATMLLTDKNAAKRSIVDVVKERTLVPLCDRSQCRIEDASVVRGFKNADLRPYDGYWGIIQHISEHFYHIYISLKGETIQCREEEVEPIDLSEGDRITLLSVSSRVSNLLKAELEAVDYAILETIQRSLYLTPRQLMHLELMEKDYGVSQ
ncbi:MAG: hypothetical protein CLLPBCKN_006213 [Chroococcidiopsis cubana SAG 39.79]|uniref:KOW domain-containing protein n=1 Tax=Chroococcidiopsis cubana SAG 39.79 TaxID=388085 RepID=A0AB37U897_9CYAN|nr:hypothetical protein [Chroococcidiopsis cubana]MDZ4876778.1 hypothetical protein [Chroococcidiopsis cubana SAG 39.79]PSB52897.1 hypothetical protein C7B79_35725 [Chroococcidiopsis cubana CCALA 043]RUS98554.1 hypothetical protein DSM107010_69310 [Chroococcidiopsis cubana SAG 39.79]